MTEKIDLGINNEPTPPRRPARQKTQPQPKLAPQHGEIIESESTTVATVENKYCNVATFVEVAQQFGLDMDIPVEAKLDRMTLNLSRSVHYMLAAGMDLLSLREECEHGEWRELLESRGIEVTAAHRAITYAQFVINCPTGDRDKLLSLPKTKVLALAKADPEVLQDLFDNEDGLADLTALSVRDMRLKIRKLEAEKVDSEVALETVDTQNQALRDEVEKLRSARVQSSGIVPIAVQDTRLEIAALHKKAELSIDDISRLTEELLAAPDVLGQYETPVARGLYRALCALSMSITGPIAQLHATYGDALGSQLAPADWLSDAEVAQVAAEYKALVREHDHEALDRQWEREMDRPAGRGRPKKRPTLD